jgi:hypothetical protein
MKTLLSAFKLKLVTPREDTIPAQTYFNHLPDGSLFKFADDRHDAPMCYKLRGVYYVVKGPGNLDIHTQQSARVINHGFAEVSYDPHSGWTVRRQEPTTMTYADLPTGTLLEFVGRPDDPFVKIADGRCLNLNSFTLSVYDDLDGEVRTIRPNVTLISATHETSNKLGLDATKPYET